MNRYDPYTDKFLRDTQYDIPSTNLAEVGMDATARTLQGGDGMIDEDAIMRIAIIYALISIIGILLLVIVAWG